MLVSRIRANADVWRYRSRIKIGPWTKPGTSTTSWRKGVDWERILQLVGKKKGRTFQSVLQRFVDSYDGWSEVTRRGNSGTIRKLIEAFGEEPINSITSTTIEQYLKRRRDHGLSVGSSNRYLALLKVLFKKCVEWGYVAHDPAESIKMKDAGEKLPYPYTDAKIKRLFGALSEEHRTIATVFLHTGMRKGELKRLVWPDVDFENAMISIRGPKNKVDRAVPISAEVYTILSKRNGIMGWTCECSVPRRKSTTR